MQDATLRQRSQKRDDAARLANNHGERRLLESSENRFVIKITICVSWQELKSRSLPHAGSPSSRDRAAGRSRKRSEARGKASISARSPRRVVSAGIGSAARNDPLAASTPKRSKYICARRRRRAARR